MDHAKIEALALASGFKLKEQPGGAMALNPYVFDFAKALLRAAAPAVHSICHHDDLVRQGAIWTKCEQCGKRWADDEGGVPKVPPAAPPVAAPAASIDTLAFSQLMCAYLGSQTDPCAARQVGESRNALVAHIDAAMAQHGQERYEAGKQEREASTQELVRNLGARMYEAEASLARLVAGIASAQQYAEAAQGGMYATRYGDYFRVSDINALLPAKAEAPQQEINAALDRADVEDAARFPTYDHNAHAEGRHTISGTLTKPHTIVATPAPAMGEELPPLPETVFLGGEEDTSNAVYGYTHIHLHTYGRACMALRQPGAEKVGSSPVAIGWITTGDVEHTSEGAEIGDWDIEWDRKVIDAIPEFSQPETTYGVYLNIAADKATAPVSQPALPQQALSDAVLAEFNRLRAIPKTPGFCNGTKYTQQEAMAMAIAAVSQPAAQEPFGYVSSYVESAVKSQTVYTAQIRARKTKGFPVALYTAPQPITAPAGSEQLSRFGSPELQSMIVAAAQQKNGGQQ